MKKEILDAAIKMYIKHLERKRDNEFNPLIKEIIQKDIDEIKKG